MALRLTIAFAEAVGPDAPDDNLVHRLRNFGEELYREFSTNGQADISLDQIDCAVSELHVTIKAKRHIGTVSAFVKKTLQRHDLNDLFTVTRN